MIDWLPHLDALLNLIAFCLLVAGYIEMRRGHIDRHRRYMLTAFGVSLAFLAVYLTHHAISGSRLFPRDAPAIIRSTYLALLATHVVLAATVPFLAVATIWFGLRDQRQKHRKLARWTFPIWVYVSITGVIVYVMLYHVYR